MTLSDGRVVKGKFQCMDRLRNFILVDAEETRMVAITPGARAGDRARFDDLYGLAREQIALAGPRRSDGGRGSSSGPPPPPFAGQLSLLRLFA